MQLHRQVLEGREGSKNLVSLMKAYLKKGGLQIVFNILDQKALREAMTHPEQHRNLVVRVAGFSEFFVKLDPKLQAEILMRTEHEIGV